MVVIRCRSKECTGRIDGDGVNEVRMTLPGLANLLPGG